MSGWVLLGTASQNAIIQSTLDRCDYPFERLSKSIPVMWSDLSRYAVAQGAVATEGHDHDAHDHDAHLSHFHTQDGDDTGHGVTHRHRVLGLFWLSGKVEIEQSLEHEPELAAEVFLAEGAHAVDYYDPHMTDDVRVAIWNAVHPEDQHIPAGTNIEDGFELGHGHGWFDIASYHEWVGEEFMGLFCAAFSNIQPSIPFAHAWDPDAVVQVRNALLGTSPPPPPEPQPTMFYASARGTTYHDSHGGVPAVRSFYSRFEAESAGLRPCKTCKP